MKNLSNTYFVVLAILNFVFSIRFFMLSFTDMLRNDDVFFDNILASITGLSMVAVFLTLIERKSQLKLKKYLKVGLSILYITFVYATVLISMLVQMLLEMGFLKGEILVYQIASFLIIVISIMYLYNLIRRIKNKNIIS